MSSTLIEKNRLTTIPITIFFQTDNPRKQQFGIQINSIKHFKMLRQYLIIHNREEIVRADFINVFSINLE